MAGIIRQPTADEKKNYNPLGRVSTKKQFLKSLANVEYKFSRDRRPFDAACAKADFETEMERLQNESMRRFEFVDKKFVSEGLNKKFSDLDRYGSLERFDLIDDNADVEQQVVTVGGNNVKKNTIVGHTLKYKCKERGHGISLCLTNDEYKNWERETKSSKKKKYREDKEEYKSN